MAQAVTIVSSGGVAVTNTISPQGRPATPVNAGGMPITLVSSGGLPMTLVDEDRSAWAPNSIDFTTNTATINSVAYSAISSIPSITGTLDLSASGHLVDAANNGIIIPLTGVTYPLTFYVEFVRNTDSGGNEVIACVDAGSAANLTMYRIDTGDQLRFRIDATPPGANQCSIGGGTTASLSTVPTAVQRAAGRADANDAQNCRNGTLGTQDTSVTLPTNPTRLIVGVDSSGAQSFTGYIRKIKIFDGAFTNAQLQALATGAL